MDRETGRERERQKDRGTETVRETGTMRGETGGQIDKRTEWKKDIQVVKQTVLSLI